MYGRAIHPKKGMVIQIFWTELIFLYKFKICTEAFKQNYRVALDNLTSFKLKRIDLAIPRSYLLVCQQFTGR